MNTNSFNQNKTILLVDDDVSIRITIKAVLENQGYKVIEVDSGEICLHICQHQIPDIILIDAVMPGMDGFSCSDQLKKIFDDECPPILMITVLDDKDSIHRSFDVGITEYIVKPFDWNHLISTIQKLIQNNQLTHKFEKLNFFNNSIDTQINQRLQDSEKKSISLMERFANVLQRKLMSTAS